MVFPRVMYGCESWTIKKAECQRIDAFRLNIRVFVQDLPLPSLLLSLREMLLRGSATLSPRIQPLASHCLFCIFKLVTARRSNQSILKEISPEYSLEGLMLKLKFQYFGHLM